MNDQAEAWKALLSPWTVKEIATLTGCPEITAFQWKQGRRVPRPWVASMLLLVLRLRTECGEPGRRRSRPGHSSAAADASNASSSRSRA